MSLLCEITGVFIEIPWGFLKLKSRSTWLTVPSECSFPVDEKILLSVWAFLLLCCHFIKIDWSQWLNWLFYQWLSISAIDLLKSLVRLMFPSDIGCRAYVGKWAARMSDRRRHPMRAKLGVWHRAIVGLILVGNRQSADDMYRKINLIHQFPFHSLELTEELAILQLGHCRPAIHYESAYCSRANFGI